MRIAELTAYHLRIPLRRPVRHALAERQVSDNLVVACRLADGTTGWGEGVPRDYVTGETIDGTFDQLAASDLAQQLGARCETFADAIALAQQLELSPAADDPRGMHGNAARCAVELSILDAAGRHFHEPLARVTELLDAAAPIHQRRDRVRYSTAITAEGCFQEIVSAWKMRLYGFAQCKLKVAMPGQNDPARLRRIRRILGRNVDLRVDANAGWPSADAAERIAALEPYAITAVEQPVAHDEVQALPELGRRVNVPIMLDESLCSRTDAEQAVAEDWCDLFNLRISKCGGFIRTLELAAFAAQHGLGYQLGCQVGETGILSAAGRHFACSVARIRYLEGSYDHHLVREWLTREDLTFGYGGRAPALERPGLGVEIDAQRVEAVCARTECWTIR
jgi:L-alanine-DL-glutamate epimerase-like enolase superfamily enzyme